MKRPTVKTLAILTRKNGGRRFEKESLGREQMQISNVRNHHRYYRNPKYHVRFLWTTNYTPFKLENLEEMNKLTEIHTQRRLNKEELENIYRPITIK